MKAKLVVYMKTHFFLLLLNAAKGRNQKYLLDYNFEETPSMHDLDREKNSDLVFFDLSDIAAATQNFSDENKLGQGGFGSVYKVPYSSVTRII